MWLSKLFDSSPLQMVGIINHFCFRKIDPHKGLLVLTSYDPIINWWCKNTNVSGQTDWRAMNFLKWQDLEIFEMKVSKNIVKHCRVLEIFETCFKIEFFYHICNYFSNSLTCLACNTINLLFNWLRSAFRAKFSLNVQNIQCQQ